ncbi:hypothetical protein [Tellurirhabdus bombi]|uniref:hypothetical protein n=1 Tax=Tellurirhabdus bombi TaxID=2907205 RepID=UPI001F1AA8C2|nr:hypothetical protein [Tellurirhabdus bombi]
MRWQLTLQASLEGQIVLLQLWYRIPGRWLQRLDGEKLTRLLKLLEFLHQLPTRWMMSRLCLGFRTYVGPGDNLECLTFGEFMFAEAAVSRYRAGKNREDLAELAAVLYQPRALPWQKESDGKRAVFDRRRLEGAKKRFLRLSDAVLHGILLNYTGCMEAFPVQFEYLFKRSDESGGASGTWLDVGLNLARNTGALGTFQQLEQTNLFLVLPTLDKMIQESEEFKTNLEKK